MEFLRKASPLLVCVAAIHVPETKTATASCRVRAASEPAIANRASVGHDDDNEIDGETCEGGEGKSGTIPGTFPKAVLRKMLDMSHFLVARKWNPCMLGPALDGGVASRRYSDDEISLMLVSKSWKAAVESCSTMQLRKRHQDLYGKMRMLQREIHMWSYLTEWAQRWIRVASRIHMLDPHGDPSALLGFKNMACPRQWSGTKFPWNEVLDSLVERQVIRFPKLTEDHLEKRQAAYEHMQTILTQLKASPLAEVDAAEASPLGFLTRR